MKQGLDPPPGGVPKPYNMDGLRSKNSQYDPPMEVVVVVAIWLVAERHSVTQQLRGVRSPRLLFGGKNSL